MNREKREMDHSEERWRALLQMALPPVAEDFTPEQDLWPKVLRRLSMTPVAAHWLDLALLAALIVLAVIFPVSIPVFLYYL